MFLLLAATLLLAVAAPAQAQDASGSISGRVTEAETGEGIPGANVVIVGTQQGASTGPDGSYVITNLDPGTYAVQASFVGYETATAIYGSRGANGVVLITTKDGRGTAPKLNVNTYTGVSTISSSIDVMAPETYVDYWNDFFPYDPEADVYQQIAYRDTLGHSVPMSALKTNDWPDQLYRSALMQNVNASLSGFAEGTNYYASVGFLNQNGSIESSDFKRITGALKLDRELREGMDAGVNLNVTSSGKTSAGPPVSTFPSTETRCRIWGRKRTASSSVPLAATSARNTSSRRGAPSA